MWEALGEKVVECNRREAYLETSSHARGDPGFHKLIKGDGMLHFHPHTDIQCTTAFYQKKHDSLFIILLIHQFYLYELGGGGSANASQTIVDGGTSQQTASQTAI